jgi:hypothetical protein
MAKHKESEPSEADLIAWAIPRIAQGHYAFTDDADGRELWVTERTPSVKEMERELLYQRPEPARQALMKLRENCNFQTVKTAFAAVFGKKFGEMVSQQFEGAPLSYEFVLAFLYSQEKGLIKNVQQLLIRDREKLSSASGTARIESGVLPKALSAAVVINYAEEFGQLFPRLIRRAEQLRVLQAQTTVPEEVQKYLQEASKCFIYGRFIACLIVCRSAIEFALRDQLIVRRQQSRLESLRQGQGDSLAAIISLARSVLPSNSRPALDAADDVRKKARDAVHKGEPDTETCKDMFVKTRGILRDLYSLSCPGEAGVY